MRGGKLYVGNIRYSARKEDLEKIFFGYGEIREIKLIEGKRFSLVELSRTAEAVIDDSE